MTVPLPPLPPASTGDDVDYLPGGRSIIDLLSDEHRDIAALCGELTDERVTPRCRRQIADVVTAIVSRHLSAEEQYLYPTVRAGLPAGARLADREVAEDQALLRTLKDLAATAPQDPRFVELAAAVAAGLNRHARTAATDLFPGLREIASTAELVRLGNRLEIAEEAAPTRPHPGTPAAPPWNKVIDPALGVIDKVRDAFSGRRTYPEDLSWRPRIW